MALASISLFYNNKDLFLKKGTKIIQINTENGKIFKAVSNPGIHKCQIFLL
jgi:hypothetical protein